MATYAIVSGGVVVNMIEAEPAQATALGAMDPPAGVGIGYTYDGNNFAAPTKDEAS